MMYRSLNPATETLITAYEETSLSDCLLRLKSVSKAQKSFRTLTAAKRVEKLLTLARLLESNKRALSNLITQEMGKPITQSEAEIEKSRELVLFSAKHLEQILIESSSKDFASVKYFWEPLGVILGIMPWNYPLWQCIRFAVPAIAMGNACLLKPAPNVPSTSLLINKIFQEGFQDVFDVFFASNETTSALIAQREIAGVSFTGSDQTGRHIASMAGLNLKKMVLELGGSDPYLVFSDAQMPQAVAACVEARFVNAGQSCLAAKRIYVAAEIFDEFISEFQNQMKALKTGAPEQAETNLGPLARLDLLEKIERQIQSSTERGAKILVGGKRENKKGFYFPASLIVNAPDDCALLTEEVFGPVAVIQSFKSENEVILRANQSRFGLGAAIFTHEKSRIERLKQQLECGTLWVNQPVRSYPSIPMAGTKDSGFGRELGVWGHYEFSNLKVIGEKV